MLCCGSLEIFNAFSFELVFCTWSPLGQWNMCMNRGYMHIYHSLPLYSHIASMMPPRLRIPVGPWSTEVPQDPEYVQGKHAASTVEWGEGGEHTQHQETMLSVQTRTCFRHRKKKKMAFSETQMNKELYCVLSQVVVLLASICHSLMLKNNDIERESQGNP